ncbi:major facilitator superfamily domain-containing protein [Lactifluus volemus]|nr:major facilitator superfamily domain-containing protein [Lactifluus volemus]
MSPTTDLFEYADEEAPLIECDDPASPKPTPLPKVQISILLSLWTAEAILSFSITPYINELVRELPIVGGDVRKVGYYTGIIVSMHHLAEALSAFLWNRLSDYVGRKPVLLSCLAGSIISIISFGFSRSFGAIVVSRCLHGALKGDIGVVKSVMGELTDDSNVALGFSLLPMTWTVGRAIGPFIGGVLARPQDRWPHLFSNPFWATYPYFLPCLATAICATLSFIVVAMYLEETVNFAPPMKHQFERTSMNIVPEESRDSLGASPKDEQMPLPLRAVLTRAVAISVLNYATLALLEIVAESLIPLIWSTSVEFGGLNFSPASIGLCISVYGFMSGIFQFIFFPRLVGRFGPRWVLVASIAAYAVVYSMFPFENLALRYAVGDGSSMTLWLLIFLQLWSLAVSEMGFSAAFIFIRSAAPNQRSLGTTNGLAQTLGSVHRSFGPAAADWLFAFSLINNILDGKLIYVVLLALVCVAQSIAAQLPRHKWTHGGK